MSPPTRLNRVVPIVPVADLRRALTHYDSLGFETLAYEGGDEYGFVERDGVELHLARCEDHDPQAENGAANLYAEDADALFREWGRPGIAGSTRRPGGYAVPTPGRLPRRPRREPDPFRLP